jgi:hypothetical protein
LTFGYLTADHAGIDGLFFPEGATNIRFNRFPEDKSNAKEPVPDFNIQPTSCITQAHRDERQRLVSAWIERDSLDHCDCSHANGAESSPPAELMFPPEEGV